MAAAVGSDLLGSNTDTEVKAAAAAASVDMLAVGSVADASVGAVELVEVAVAGSIDSSAAEWLTRVSDDDDYTVLASYFEEYYCLFVAAAARFDAERFDAERCCCCCNASVAAFVFVRFERREATTNLGVHWQRYSQQP